MLFTSYAFIGFMLVTVILYYLVPKKIQTLFLLAASYAFYAFAGWQCLVYIAAITLIVYAGTMAIERSRDRQTQWVAANKPVLPGEEIKKYKHKQQNRRQLICIAVTAAIVLILAVAKYLEFILSNLNSVFSFTDTSGPVIRSGFLSGFLMPMGISFYVLQALGYLIDVYRETVQAEKNLIKTALFISFFPQLIQGPISRFQDLSKTLFVPHSFDWHTVSFGLQRVLWGFFKKLVIADRILIGVKTIISDTAQYNGAYVFIGMILFSLELYADFSGGIDIAIGVGQMLGITIQENFDRPYFSRSLKEYWRRWHMSMCNWFRTYLFFSVSTAPWMQKFTKFCRRKFSNTIGKNLPVYASSLVVWFTTGLWHGANWNYVVWGLLNWFILMMSEILEPLYAKFRNRIGCAEKLPYRLFQMLRTFLLICCMNVFDWELPVRTTVGLFGSIFTAGNWHIIADGSLLKLGLGITDYIIIGIGLLIVLTVSLLQNAGSVRERIAARPFAVRYIIWFGMFVSVLLFGIYGIGYDAAQFIYNRF